MPERTGRPPEEPAPCRVGAMRTPLFQYRKRQKPSHPPAFLRPLYTGRRPIIGDDRGWPGQRATSQSSQNPPGSGAPWREVVSTSLSRRRRPARKKTDASIATPRRRAKNLSSALRSARENALRNGDRLGGASGTSRKPVKGCPSGRRPVGTVRCRPGRQGSTHRARPAGARTRRGSNSRRLRHRRSGTR